MKTRELLLAALLAGAPLAAQTNTFVVPPAYAAVEAAGSLDYHWMVGRYTTGRAQQIYARAVLPPSPVALRAFKMRRDGLQAAALDHLVDMEVLMSNRAVDPADGCGLVFAANHGPDLAKVMNKRAIHWPALPGGNPCPFSIPFALDLPFLYKGQALVIDWKYTPNPGFAALNYDWSTDAVYDAAWAGGYQAGTRFEFGTGCPADFYNYGYFPYPGAPFWKYGYAQSGRTNSYPGICIIGQSRTLFGALPLPFDLGPLGAPGCSLHIDLLAAAAAMTDPGYPYSTSTGRIDFQMGAIPFDYGLVGARYMIQLMVLDPAFNALGLRASLGREYTVGPYGFRNPTQGFALYAYDDGTNSYSWRYDEVALYHTARANIIELTY